MSCWLECQMARWQFIHMIRHILNVIIICIYYLDVLDCHQAAIVGFCWDEDKKMLISVSHDKSVKLYQFPIFWPSEIIRGSRNKNKISLIEGKDDVNKEDDEEIKRNEAAVGKENVDALVITRSDNDIEIREKYRVENKTEIDKNENEEEKYSLIQEKKKNLRKLNEEEIYCFDLDGWDTSFD